uniref:Ig-like domain-containing protein n=1 Tax=Sinocyclocheilus grahami TaxID=75366 RepID=A0A672N5Y8_SINGR
TSVNCTYIIICHTLSVIIKPSGRTARIQCQEETLQSNALHWYRLKDQAFQRLMYFEAKSNTGKSDPGVPARYAGSVKGNTVTLTISTLELSDAGSYYCALWSGDNNTVLTKVFGSGTRLYVTGSPVKSPKLYGYLPSKNDKRDKQTMLCQASGMFPDLVKFTWKKKSETGQLTDVPEENVVEQTNKNAVTVTSMMIIDKNTAENNDYQCTVVHEGITDKLQTLEMKRGNLKKL